jgi:hypothetical protein
MKPDFASDDWLPLKDAFARTWERLGARDLAAGELFAALCDGRLGAGAIEIPSKGPRQQIVADIQGKQHHLLPPEFFKSFEGLTYTDHGAVRLWPSQLRGSWYIYVRSSDFDALYPRATPKAVDPMKPAPRRRGPPATYDWHLICGEIARRCINPKTRRLTVPENESALVEEMLLWCGTEMGKEPAVSAMREAVKRVCAALRDI